MIDVHWLIPEALVFMSGICYDMIYQVHIYIKDICITSADDFSCQ